MAGYVNDTQTLANIVSPAYAAMQAGINSSNQQEAEELANQKSLATLPYAGQQAAADVAYKNAATGLTGQQAQELGLKNIFTQGTQEGAIKAANAKSATEYTEQQAKSIGMVGQIAGQLAGQLDEVPAPARPAFMQQYLQSKGLNVSDFGPLASGDPDMIRNFSQKAIQASQDYQTKLMQENSSTQRAESVAGIGANARVSAAEATANARVQAARVSAQMHQQMQTAEQAAVAAKKAGNDQLANQYAQLAQNLRQAQAGITGQLVGQPLPQPFPTAAGGDQGAPAPTQQQPQQTAPTAPASDGTYEYRIGPDGSVQRRALKK